MANGGKRPGAGRKKGGKNQKTIEKEIALKRYESRIIDELDPLIQAQLDVAKGVTVMMAREWERKNGKRARTGKFVRVTAVYDIEQLLNGDGENGEDYYYISTLNPDGKVLENLMNRVFGKPKESLELDFTRGVKEALEKLNSILR